MTFMLVFTVFFYIFGLPGAFAATNCQEALTAKIKFGTGSGVGGGDVLADEFQNLLRSSIFELGEINGGVIRGKRLPIQRLTQQLQDLTVEMTSGELLRVDGVTKIALNFPDRDLIMVDRDVWMGLSHSEKVRLALHEYFGLRLREVFDDTNFAYSGPAQRELQDAGSAQIDPTLLVEVKEFKAVDGLQVKLLFERRDGRRNPVRAYLVFGARSYPVAIPFLTVSQTQLKWVNSSFSMAAGYWLILEGERLNEKGKKVAAMAEIKLSDSTGVALDSLLFNYPEAGPITGD